MYKIGLSSCGKTINEELFAAYAAAGIDVMEISPGMDAYASLNYEEMAALSRKYGVEIRSFHLPFMPFDKIDILVDSVGSTLVPLTTIARPHIWWQYEYPTIDTV